jgi:hypothetical protein
VVWQHFLLRNPVGACIPAAAGMVGRLFGSTGGYCSGIHQRLQLPLYLQWHRPVMYQAVPACCKPPAPGAVQQRSCADSLEPEPWVAVGSSPVNMLAWKGQLLCQHRLEVWVGGGHHT